MYLILIIVMTVWIITLLKAVNVNASKYQNEKEIYELQLDSYVKQFNSSVIEDQEWTVEREDYLSEWARGNRLVMAVVRKALPEIRVTDGGVYFFDSCNPICTNQYGKINWSAHASADLKNIINKTFEFAEIIAKTEEAFCRKDEQSVFKLEEERVLNSLSARNVIIENNTTKETINYDEKPHSN